MSSEIVPTFRTQIFQGKDERNPYEIPSNMLMIDFLLNKATGSCPYDNRTHITYDSPPRLVKYKTIVIKHHDFLLSSERIKQTWMLSGILTSMDVPEDKHPTIIDKIFLAVEAADVPGPPLTCSFLDLRIKLRRPKVVTLECLEKVRLDCLEDATRRDICGVCLDHLDGVEEGIAQQLMITRLPCLHLFHEDCIVKLSKVNHLCPLCRYPMPTIEEEEPSVPWKMNWPMFLTVLGYGLHSAHWWYIHCYAGRHT